MGAPDVNIPIKQTGSDLFATEINQLATGVNNVGKRADAISKVLDGGDFIQDGTAIVDGVAVPLIKINPARIPTAIDPETKETILVKLEAVDGVLPVTLLPPVYIMGSGTGTQNDPIIPISAGGNLDAYFKSLPGYDANTDKILYSGANGIVWGVVPAGGAQTKLDTPILSFGQPAVDSIPAKWNSVIDAATYTLQRDIVDTFATAVTIYTGLNLQYTDIALSANTQYYYRVRSNAPGFISSDFATGSLTTLATGATTPNAPTNPIVNDTLDTFDWTNNPLYTAVSDYEISVDFGTTYTVASAKPYQVGNISKASGQVGVRVKGVSGTRNPSATLFNPAPYTVAAVKAAKPTNPVTDDALNTFDWTNNPNFTAIGSYEQTLDGGTTYTVCTQKPIAVGDFNKPIGQVGVRVKAAPQVIASDTLFNTVAFTGTDGLTPITTWIEYEGFIPTTNNLAAPDDTTLNRARSSAYIPSGVVGSVQAVGFARLGLDDNPNTLSYGGQFKFGINVNSVTFGVTASVTTSFNNNGTVTNTTTPMIRLRLTLTTVFFEYSNDSGTTWLPSRNSPRIDGLDYYIKADEGYSRLDKLNNILGGGVQINTSLT